MKILSRLLLVALLAVGLTTGLSANGLNLNGFGARAAAMGGAYVGLANDYTAVFWNPAGLAQLKEGIFGLSADFLMPSAKYTIPDYSQESKSKTYPAGLVGYFTPVSENIVVGLGAYTLSGLGVAWNNTGLEAALVAPYPPSVFTPTLGTSVWESFIGSVTLAPTIAIKVSEMVYLGASFNINYGFFKTQQWGTFMIVPPSTLVNFGQQVLDVKGWGFGATFGAMIKPAEWISVGATFRTQSKINLSGTSEVENVDLVGLPNSSGAKMSVISPMWLAGGVAITPVKNLTWTIDAQYTNWGKLDSIAVEFDDPAWVAGMADSSTLLLNWTDQTQFRTGLEYDFGKFALRGGYYYDPAPAPDETMNILTPSFTFNSVQAGFGYKSGGLHLDVALEYVMGQDRNVPPSDDNMPGLYEMNIVVPMIGFSYRW